MAYPHRNTTPAYDELANATRDPSATASAKCQSSGLRRGAVMRALIPATHLVIGPRNPTLARLAQAA